MQVRDIIEKLKKYPPEEELISAWWDRRIFPQIIDDEAWESFCYTVEERLDWSSTYDAMLCLGEDAVNGLYDGIVTCRYKLENGKDGVGRFAIGLTQDQVGDEEIFYYCKDREEFNELFHEGSGTGFVVFETLHKED